MYNTAGLCLSGEQGLGEFAEEALSWNGDTFTCGERGLEVRNRDKEEKGEEEEDDGRETSDAKETEHNEGKGEVSDELVSDELKSATTESESEYVVTPPPDRRHMETVLLESESGRTPVKSSRKMGERVGASNANHHTFRYTLLAFVISVYSYQNF